MRGRTMGPASLQLLSEFRRQGRRPQVPRTEVSTDTAVEKGKAGCEETRLAGLGSGGWRRTERHRAGRRLHWLLGFAGPCSEAEDIKQRIKAWLREHLDLALSDEKTLITHATTQAARFLGYE